MHQSTITIIDDKIYCFVYNNNRISDKNTRVVFSMFRRFRSKNVIVYYGMFGYTTNELCTNNFVSSNSPPRRSFGWTRTNKQSIFVCYWLTTRTGSYTFILVHNSILIFTLHVTLAVLREKQNSDRRFKLNLIGSKKFRLFNIHMIKKCNSASGCYNWLLRLSIKLIR